ncbi:hypothetical protein [Prosthecobacter sp.]|uniref:hypothetical protein n=1 Tax=Prosthecobacter sp. TaxID=1965333 RepID=UPI002ABBAF27|nr:hypothetical protein [Prosthecobacter sp.]MDZ4403000.1 hypothetical protein [Prosthecobacter sp.]
MTVSDLSPDALARLEAKLVADLEMVRKVRALLEEHRPLLATTPAPVSVSAAPASPIQSPAPAEKRKSSEEIFLECLVQMPEGGFAPQDFKRAIYKVTRNFPETSTVKTFLNRMIRQGKVIIAEARTGRNGSLYRCTIPRPVPAETPPASADSPAVSAEFSPAKTE